MIFGLVALVLVGCAGGTGPPEIADTSDPKWLSMLQRQWPVYIMGARLGWGLSTRPWRPCRLISTLETTAWRSSGPRER